MASGLVSWLEQLKLCLTSERSVMVCGVRERIDSVWKGGVVYLKVRVEQKEQQQLSFLCSVH